MSCSSLSSADNELTGSTAGGFLSIMGAFFVENAGMAD